MQGVSLCLEGGQQACGQHLRGAHPSQVKGRAPACWPRHRDAVCVEHQCRCVLDVGGVFCRLSPCVTLCVCGWAFMGSWGSWRLWSKAHTVVK